MNTRSDMIDLGPLPNNRGKSQSHRFQALHSARNSIGPNSSSTLVAAAISTQMPVTGAELAIATGPSLRGFINYL